MIGCWRRWCCRAGARARTRSTPPPGSAAELARLVLSPGRVPGPLGTAIAPWRSRRPRPVGWAVGCALAGRTATLRALGPFSDSIFMYGEDLELGLRAARSGVRDLVLAGRPGDPPGRPFDRRRLRGRAVRGARAGPPRGGRDGARRDRGADRDDRRQAALFASRAAIKRALRRDHRRELAQLAACGV